MSQEPHFNSEAKIVAHKMCFVFVIYMWTPWSHRMAVEVLCWSTLIYRRCRKFIG